MADDVKAAPALDTAKVEQDVSWIGARLREKSTYAGLLVLLGLVAPHLTDPSALVSALSMIGMGVGGLIAIILPEKTVAKAAAIVVLAILAGSLLFAPAPAFAQNQQKLGLRLAFNTPTRATASAASTASTAATMAAQPKTLADLIAQLSAVQASIVAGAISDMQAADLDASTVITPATSTTPAVVKDPIAHACYPAAEQFLQSLPTATAPTGQYVAIQLFQKQRDFIALIKAGLPTYLVLGCAPLFGDEVATLTQLLGAVGVKILPAALTALVPALAPITLPAMTLVP